MTMSLYRSVPLALTGGGGLFDWNGTSGSVRIPFEHGVSLPRWRVHFRNINPRDGRPGQALVRMSQIAIGESAGDGAWATEPTVIATGLRGTPQRTQWQHTPLIAGREYLLAYSWESDVPPRRVVGGGWIVSDVTAGDAILSRTQILPLDAWIEAEVPAATTVFAAFGDSLSTGVTATAPVRDSWPSIYGRRIGALPIHYTASGDTMKGWENPDHYKWSRWEHLTRPDFAIHAMGYNDIGNNAPLWELQRRHLATVQILNQRLTDRVRLAAITPSASASPEQLHTRRAYNLWLETRDPNLIRFNSAVSADDLRLDTAFDVDGAQMNTEGYRRMASIIPSFGEDLHSDTAEGSASGSEAEYSRQHLEPISLTRPLGDRFETLTSRSCRIPFRVPRGTTRWRVVIRNFSYRSHRAYPGQVRLRFLGYELQRRDGAGAPTSSFQAPPREIVRDIFIADASHEWSSPWVDEPLEAGGEYLLALGYQTNGSETALTMGGGWWTFYRPTNAEMTEDPSAAPTRRLPFDIRIEVAEEADSEAPYRVDLLVGDSISAASDATFPVLEAPLAIANRQLTAHTRLHTFGGAAITEWIGPNWGNPHSPKWRDMLRYGHADRVLIALGSNDIHAGKALEQLQLEYRRLVQQLREQFGAHVIACTVTPRTAWVDTPMENTRQAFNGWLRSCPDGIDECVDTARAVEDRTGHAPNPDLVAKDGIHFNSAGAVAIAAEYQ